MERDEVRTLLAAGVNPYDVAIRKWEDIILGTGKDDGSHNCALCAALDDCAKCGFEDECNNGVYDEFVTHVIVCGDCDDDDAGIYCDNAKVLAKKVIDVLSALRDGKVAKVRKYNISATIETDNPDLAEEVRDAVETAINEFDELEDWVDVRMVEGDDN